MPGHCSLTLLVQSALLEKLVQKAQCEEINNESESHQMPVAADRLEPRMRTHHGCGWAEVEAVVEGKPMTGPGRGGEVGRRGCGGLQSVVSCLPDCPLAPFSPGAWGRGRGRVEALPCHFYGGCSCKIPTAPSEETTSVQHLLCARPEMALSSASSFILRE